MSEMLSIGKLGGNKADYYLNAVAKGVEDYYTGAGEAPGWWTGSAADEIDVFGQVDGEMLHRALAGEHPKTGGQLAKPARGAIRVPGYDLTFSAPKSVSLLYALGDSDVSREAREAHDVAVQAALGYMESQAAVGRRGRCGVVAVAGNGFLAAAFRHRTSRAGDPQLHTHVLVANMTRGPDGRWTALDARRLYAHARTGGFLYQAQLRAELTRRLGVEWTAVRNGQAEIAGFASPLLRAFSRRRAEVQARMRERGEHSSRAAQAAALDTRRAKDYAVNSETLVHGWRRRALQLGFEPKQLIGLLRRAEPRVLDEKLALEVQDELAGSEGLTRGQSSFTRRDVVRAWCERLPQGGDVELIEALADEFLRSERAVPLLSDGQGLAGTDVIRRANGRVVPATAEGRPYSTPEMLAIERAAIERALGAGNANVGVVSSAHIEEAITRRPTLAGEQAVMVRRLCGEGAAVQVVVGKPGTGKTFAMDAAREAWEAQGHRVLGAALARRAALELHDGAGIESTSITALLADLREVGSRGVLGDRASVLVIDEAGMVGTRQLAEILEHVLRANAKLVLVGDPHQLPEIHAGGLFRALAVRTDPIVLRENRRQQDAWEREALDLLRGGQVEEALRRYRHNDRLVVEHSADHARTQMVTDWWRSCERGNDVVMIALRRDDVRDLNERARAVMAAAGRLSEASIEVAGREFAVGDHVVTLQNNRRLGVLNGTRAEIVAIDPDHDQIEITTSDGRKITLPPSYLSPPGQGSGPRLDHAYAITGHKAQGMTADTVLVLGSEALYAEWGYTALSRGRTGNRLYLTAPSESAREEFAPGEKKRDPVDAAISSLQRSRAELLAIDTALTHQLAAAPTGELLREFDELRQRITPNPAFRRAQQLQHQRATAQRHLLAAEERLREVEDPDVRATPEMTRERAVLDQARERVATLRDQEHQASAHADDFSASPASVQLYLALRRELVSRDAGLRHVLVVDPPDYLTNTLGPVPERISERRRWQRAALDIESYRERFAVDDPDSALGSRPTDLRQRAEWRQLHTSLHRAIDAREQEHDRAIER